MNHATLTRIRARLRQVERWHGEKIRRTEARRRRAIAELAIDCDQCNAPAGEACEPHCLYVVEYGYPWARP